MAIHNIFVRNCSIIPSRNDVCIEIVLCFQWYGILSRELDIRNSAATEYCCSISFDCAKFLYIIEEYY